MSFHTETLLSLENPDWLIQLMGQEMAEHDVAVTQTSNAGLEGRSEYGLLRLSPDQGGLRLEIIAEDATKLFILRESLEAHLAGIRQALSAPVVWSGHRHHGLHPPHFRQAVVRDVTRVSPGFIRLRCQADDLSRYTQDGLHFRLLLPPDNIDPVWPTVDASGSTIWPDGPHRLHMPVYTFHEVNPADGWFSFDVYLHGNGPTCAWAKHAKGSAIGIMGPGGGWVPKAERLILAGDETAIPAIARICRLLCQQTPRPQITALIEAENPADLPELLPHCTGHPVKRGGLLAALQQSFAQTTDSFVWYSSEKSNARQAKAWLQRQGQARDKMQVTAYWTAQDTS